MLRLTFAVLTGFALAIGAVRPAPAAPEQAVVATVTGHVIDGADGDGVRTSLATGAVKINNNSILNVGVGVIAANSTGATTISNNTVVSANAGIALNSPAATITITGKPLISPAGTNAGASKLRTLDPGVRPGN